MEFILYHFMSVPGVGERDFFLSRRGSSLSRKSGGEICLVLSIIGLFFSRESFFFNTL